MNQVAPKRFSYAEYLALEEQTLERSEYYKGEIFVMAGGKLNHNIIAANLVTQLNLGLANQPCIVTGSDMKIRIEAADYSTYADAVVICGEANYYNNRPDILTNPLLLTAVLSPSTRKFDRTEKFEFYRMLSSFQHYLIVDAERVYVEYYQFTGELWLLRLYNQLNQTVKLALPHGEVELPLTQIYQKVVI
jgi:Uma2 family endonuclease